MASTDLTTYSLQYQAASSQSTLMRNTYPTTWGNLDFLLFTRLPKLLSVYRILSIFQFLKLFQDIAKNLIMLLVPRFRLILEFFVLRYNFLVCLQGSLQ